MISQTLSSSVTLFHTLALKTPFKERLWNTATEEETSCHVKNQFQTAFNLYSGALTVLPVPLHNSKTIKKIHLVSKIKKMKRTEIHVN